MVRSARPSLARLVFAVAMWLGIGVVISLALAWVPLCIPTTIGPQARPVYISDMPWPHDVLAGHGLADGTLMPAWAFEATVLSEHGVSGGNVLGMLEIRAGWPMRCCVGWDTNARPFFAPGSRHGLLEFKPPWMGTVMLPMLPEWGGLAINATLFGIAARASWWGTERMRRNGRRERGECEACGYSRDGLESGAACPECGNVR